MPQMSPLYWLLLMIFFSITLILFSTFNYSIKPLMKTNKKSKILVDYSILWKW
uniref:ATP synthase complex subunit 8 n=1 Tax=Thor amboinensis TaxID=652917 RepID=A0A7G7MWN2_9EUCA|nr:ATP synthase F0 subunit 8 [Thor amboinensis]QNG57241.1 ATP synthase F0 subunit 8 [Thor amboinensis]